MYVLGIDQGGTKTYAVVSDHEGNMLGMGMALGGCHSITGMEHAMSQIKLAVDIALSQSKIDINEISQTVSGMTGADFDYEYPLLQKNIKETLGLNHLENIHIVNDCVIAMRAGTKSPSGAIVCAGTGINCGIVNTSGEQFIFGYYMDDCYQGGGSIGRAALVAVFEAEVLVSEPTTLKDKFLTHFKVKTVDKLLQDFINKVITIEEVVGLVPLVIDCAERGDKVANKLLSDFGYNAARFVIAGIKKLHMENENVEIVLSGSIFKCRLPILKETFSNTVKSQINNVEIIEARLEPIVGAVIMALEKQHTNLTQEMVDKIEASAQKYNLIRITN